MRGARPRGRPKGAARPARRTRAATVVVCGEWDQPIEAVARIVQDAMHDAGLCGCGGGPNVCAVWARYDDEGA